MRAVTILFGGILTLMILALAYRIIVPSEPTYSPSRYNTYMLDQERAEAIAPLKTFAAATWWTLLAVAPALGLGAVIAVAVDRVRHRRPDDRGLLPVAAEDVPSVAIAALQSHHQAQLAHAQRVILPSTLHYAPKVSSSTSEAAPSLAGPAAPLNVPSLAALLADGTIGRTSPNSKMILGYDADGPVMGSWGHLYSCAVGGIAGSGKSSTISFLLAQAALRGARLYLIDPHGGDRESLTQRLGPMAAAFGADPADDQASIGKVIRLVETELDRRMRGHPDRTPVIVAIDEYSSLIRGAGGDDLALLVESVAQQGRKLGIFAQVGGQVWSGSRSGGTQTRDSLASFYVHRIRPAQARYMTGLLAADLPDDLIDLPPGEAYLLDTFGDLRRVRMPLADEGSMAAVGKLLTDDAPTLTIPRQAPGNPEAVVLPTHPNAVEAMSDGDRRIVERFLAGESIPDICRAISGVTNGRGYTKAQGEVAEALRKALGK